LLPQSISVFGLTIHRLEELDRAKPKVHANDQIIGVRSLFICRPFGSIAVAIFRIKIHVKPSEFFAIRMTTVFNLIESVEQQKMKTKDKD
jgi:hypothetical protein